MQTKLISKITSSFGYGKSDEPVGLLKLIPVLILLIPIIPLYLYHNSWLPWGDEVQFADPGASLYFKQGFTSMAWPYQSASEFFMGNAPGYSLLLGPWFNAWGFGLTEARSLVWLLAAASSLLLWTALTRTAPKPPAWLKAVILATCFCSHGVILSYWSARYDMLGLFVGCSIFLLMTFPPSPGRRALFIFMGALLFYAGFHLVFAALIFFAILGFLAPQRYRQPGMALATGAIIGIAFWLLILAVHSEIKKFTIISFGSQHTLTGQVAQLVLQGDKGFYKKFTALADLPTLDLSLSLMGGFCLLVSFLADNQKHKDGFNTDLYRLAIVFILLLPVLMLLAGKFAIYYVYLAYVPAVTISAVVAWRQWRNATRLPMYAFVAAALIASVIGIHNWIGSLNVLSGNNYAHFDGWVRSSLNRDDVVYSDFEGYFSARSVSKRVAVSTYGQTSLVPGIPEKSLVTALLVRRPDVDAAQMLIGGPWRIVAEWKTVSGQPLPSARLDYVLLRR